MNHCELDAVFEFHLFCEKKCIWIKNCIVLHLVSADLLNWKVFWRPVMKVIRELSMIKQFLGATPCCFTTSLLLSGLLLVNGCTSLDIIVPQNAEHTQTKITICATVDEDSSTKTTFHGNSIWWTPGDAINVFYGSLSSSRFSTDLLESASTADFSGYLEAVTGTIEGSKDFIPFWGVYPYSETNTCDGTSVTMSIPDIQSAVAGTFANRLNPSVAKSLGLEFSFKNVGSWFVFSVTQSGITSAVLQGNEQETLAGDIRVTMDPDGLPVSTVINGSTQILLNAPSGGFVPGEQYYFVLLPQTMAQGYSLTLKKGLASGTFVSSGSKEFKRSYTRGKLNADSGMTFSGDIQFSDALVASLCVSNWDTDQDGQLSYSEAAAVTDLGTVFKGKGITAFDELQYFTGLTSIGDGSFQNCSQLCHLIIPQGVTGLGNSCFSGCSSMSGITIPSGVTSIAANAFSNCPTLLSIKLLPITPPTLVSNALNTGGAIVIHVPEDAVSDYIKANGWKDYADKIFSSVSPEYVDMGLSVKWAKCNVGATTEGDKGNTYHWGSLVPMKNTSDKSQFSDYTGEMLPVSRDIASVAYGNGWRYPSKAEWQELLDNCTAEYTAMNGNNGYLFTSRINGSTFFIPQAEYWLRDNLSPGSGSAAKIANVASSTKTQYSWYPRNHYIFIHPVKE